MTHSPARHKHLLAAVTALGAVVLLAALAAGHGSNHVQIEHDTYDADEYQVLSVDECTNGPGPTLSTSAFAPSSSTSATPSSSGSATTSTVTASSTSTSATQTTTTQTVPPPSSTSTGGSSYSYPTPYPSEEYCQLVRDEQGVHVPGPDLLASDGYDLGDLFVADEPSIQVFGGSSEFPYPADGIRVRVNDRLSYEIVGDDFENEVALARVILHGTSDAITAAFVFVGTGDGVAHNLKLSVHVDGAGIRQVGELDVESRSQYGSGSTSATPSSTTATASGTSRIGITLPLTTTQGFWGGGGGGESGGGGNDGGDPGVAPLSSLVEKVPGGWLTVSVGGFGLVTTGVMATMPTARRAVTRAVLLAPLFSRLQREKALDHPVRSHVMDMVEAEPGIHFHELQRRLELSNGVLEHHVRKLVALGLVSAQPGPRYTCYFPKGRVDRSLMMAAPLLKTPASRNVLAFIAAHPGSTNGAIGEGVGLSYSGVTYQLQRLQGAGLVQVESVGREVRVYVTPVGISALSQFGNN